jgi:hypothetical protein
VVNVDREAQRTLQDHHVDNAHEGRSTANTERVVVWLPMIGSLT